MAHADDVGPDCAPGLSLATYRAIGCVYGITNFAQTPGELVRINIYAPGLDSVRSNAVDLAINNWNTSGAHIRLARVGSTGYANLITVETGALGTNCSTSAWAQSWGGDAAGELRYKVRLNYQIFGCSSNQDTWTALVGHEFGHNLGLFHNSHYTGPLQPFMRGSIQAKFLTGEPIQQATYVDLSLLNSIYPSYPVRCASSHSDDNCNGMDPVQQSCTSYLLAQTTTSVGNVQLEASSNCRTNWAQATVTAAGWHIYRILVDRQSGPDGGALRIEDTPYSTFYYGNMLHSPNNLAEACVTFRSDAGALSGPHCTGYH